MHMKNEWKRKKIYDEKGQLPETVESDYRWARKGEWLCEVKKSSVGRSSVESFR